MADLVEALAGAIYIDSNCQLEPVWKASFLLAHPAPTAILKRMKVPKQGSQCCTGPATCLLEISPICVSCFHTNSMHFGVWPRLCSQSCLSHSRPASEEPMGQRIHSRSAVQVLYDIMMPLPTPETVAIHPVRVLMEKASKRHFTLRFRVDRRADHLYDVDGYINLYLIARCCSSRLSC